MLKKEDFATEELWAAYEADLDRERTQASATARANALKDSDRDVQARIDAAVADERVKLEASEAERVAIDRKKIDADRASLAADRKSLAATKKLMGAGFVDDDVVSLLPLFSTVADESFEPTLDSFIKLHALTVKNQVDAAKQALLTNATPPNGPTDAPTDALHTASELAGKGQEAAAVQVLLTDAGY